MTHYYDPAQAQALYQAYRDQRTDETRNAVVLYVMPAISGYLRAHDPGLPQDEIPDLAQFLRLRMIECVEKYNPNKSTLWTYVNSYIRWGIGNYHRTRKTIRVWSRTEQEVSI